METKPVEKIRRLYFDNDQDQDCFRTIYNALALCEPHQKDVRMLFLQSRLFSKLDKFSLPAPAEVPPICGLRRQRMLPPYPGKPISLDLTLNECGLIEVCLQLVPWPDLPQAKAAATAYEFLLNSELVEIPLATSVIVND